MGNFNNKKSFGGGKGGNRSGGSGRDNGRGNDRPEMHKAICSDCNKKCEVPFKPSGDKPIFCRDCFGEKKERGFKDSNDSKRRNDDRSSYRIPSPSADTSKVLAQVNRKLDQILKILSPSDSTFMGIEEIENQPPQKSIKPPKREVDIEGIRSIVAQIMNEELEAKSKETSKEASVPKKSAAKKSITKKKLKSASKKPTPKKPVKKKK